MIAGSEWCHACGRPSGAGFSVPDEVWRAVARDRWNLLCIVCFAAFADERLIEWDKDISFWPVSLITSLRGAGYEVRPIGAAAREAAQGVAKEPA